MSDTDTSLLQKNDGKDSTFFGVSIRAWLAFMLVSAVVGTQLIVSMGVVYDAIRSKDWGKVGTFANIGEPLYGMSMIALGFYYGQKTGKT